jgi:hypothetical protein
MKWFSSRFVGCFAALACLCASAMGAETDASKLDFNHDIRPILSNYCHKCHGPDAAQRQGGSDGLRLDTRDGALADQGGYAAIVPGKPEKSALIERIRSTDDDMRMPPKEMGKRLSPREVELLTKWIEQGAPYATHWSYAQPARPPLPAVKQTNWPRNELDRFILARLEREGLTPTPQADRAALLRRVSLDLTGLPPTLADLEVFASQYESYVDKLLDSPAYGEHWARAWLDLARYADSAGYADDPPRTIWLFRDYVIRSLNANKPLDQFTIEQIAGDLLPNPTDEQLIATAFNRNTTTNNEGGTSDEEFRSVAIVDRVNTTLAVWMGTTIACAQCHNHKYDPVTQAEYFQLYAFFNNTADADKRDESPLLARPTEQELQQQAAKKEEIKKLTEKLAAATPELLEAQKKWEAELADEEKLTAAKLPEAIAAIVKTAADQRTEAQQGELTKHYLSVAPELDRDRKRLETLKKQVADFKPAESVPIMRDLPPDKRRVTKLQYRGNYLEQGPEVSEGTPGCFPPLADGAPKDRLALARWLIDDTNPLTARVFANRFWEQLFGIGIVATSEEFGSQGELPSHPELLDWLATELVRLQWNQKAFLKMLVTSATYRQSSRVTPELAARDPDNRLLARGPRVRLSAEMVRDQALALSGLLSNKMYGPPVKPPQPPIELKAAFGSAVDWQDSAGEDKFRRALYTSWRRSNPYPSMATFDAPNREVCTIRRDRTNTPLQALVTLNDPVFIEAAQALARRIVLEGGASPRERLAFGMKLCLARDAHAAELDRLLKFYEASLADYRANSEAAKKMATDPLGPLPDGQEAAELAAWTVVGNVLLNLDEMLMKR